MLKKLLYLYNDGHNPFPKLGKGGLGYHLPQFRKRIHGEALHRTVNEDGDVLDEYNDGDMEDPHTYDTLFDEGFEDVEDEEEYYPNPVGRVEYDQNGDILRKGFYNDENRIIFDDYLDENEKEKLRETKSRHQVTIDELNEDRWMEEIANNFDNMINNQYYFRKQEIKDSEKDAVFNQVYKNLIADKKNKYKDVYKSDINKAMKDLGFEYVINLGKEQSSELEDEVKAFKNSKHPTNGEAFEELMLKKYKDELLTLTQKKGSPFRTPDENPLYFNTDGTPKTCETKRDGILMIVDLYKNTLFDAGNKDTEIEFKFEPERDDLEIQIGKFTGNTKQLPLFHIVNGQWKLYNVYNSNIDLFVNKYENKNIEVVVLLNDGKYKFSITNFIQNNPDIELNLINKNGMNLYRIDEDSLLQIFETTNRDINKYNNKKKWIKIPKDYLTKLT